MTETQSISESVALKEERYERIFETAADGVLIIDFATRKIIDVNPFFLGLIGCSRDEVLGKELNEIGVTEDEEATNRVFRELQEKGWIHCEQLKLQTKAGEQREIEVMASLYKENGHQVVQANFRDITQRRRIARELAEKARLLDLSNDAIIARDLNDNINLWNKGAEKLYGWKAEEVLGKHLHTLLKTEFPKPLKEIVAQLYDEGQFSGEVVQIARDGRHVPSLCRWVLDRSSETILSSYTDISGQKKIEKELRGAHAQLNERAALLENVVGERTADLSATNRHLEAFVYSIAHDLRAPLRAMQGFSELLVQEAGAGLSARGKEYARRINDSAQFMDSLLLDLLTFSRISQQTTPLSSVPLRPVVESVLSRLDNEIRDKNAQVEDIGPWRVVMAHAPTLAQILHNLISNALKFSRDNVPPVVRLWTEEREGFIRVWVEDNGIGMAADHQTQIFRLFTRLQGEKYPGTGIGLAIVQKGIERMSGRLGVESQADRGSRFWFELRAAEETPGKETARA